MLNQVVLVGRVTRPLETKKGVSTFTIKVPRPYKNADGIYEDDIIQVHVHEGMVNNLTILETNYLVGVRGRLSADHGRIRLNAEKISFLSGSN